MNDHFVQGPPFFESARADGYVHHSGNPWLLRRDGEAFEAFADPTLAANWMQKQEKFIRWTRDAAMFNEADVAQNHSIYNRWFAADPARRLSGRVLDVGGGWGLFREWWSPGGNGCFVVHDPGVERFTSPPPEALQHRFATGLTRPAWFVEGFGEDLPYRDGAYDTVAVISALDHCAEPDRVLVGSARVLRSAGRLFIIQGFEPQSGEKVLRRSFTARLARLLADPRRLHRAVRQRLFHRGDPHMHHFTREELRALVAASGFIDIRETIVSERFGVAVIEARSRN